MSHPRYWALCDRNPPVIDGFSSQLSFSCYIYAIASYFFPNTFSFCPVTFFPVFFSYFLLLFSCNFFSCNFFYCFFFSVSFFPVTFFPTIIENYPDSKVHGAIMEPTWVLAAPGGPHVGPIILAIRVAIVDEWSTRMPPPTGQGQQWPLWSRGDHNWI